jgi:hypothetical protein
VEPEQVAAEPVPTPQRVEPEPASAPPPDPHAHLRAWTYEQLQVRASLHIPHGERMAIEAELNRRIAESTANPPVGMLTAEELRAGRTLRYSMDHGAWVKAYH